MALSAGSKLGPYEMIAPLGAGGMGQVFRARDPRLGREVAVKIIPSEFGQDPGRRARFEQEARAAAALNHPNILGLYDIGEENAVLYLVTELVAGETLAALIEREPIPVRKLLDIAIQIADGIASAHAVRITHRDLKPANIMITGADSGNPGRVKILDFGLAKQASQAARADETVTLHQTEPGMIVGTVNYMSPEQARGKPVDYRSDQFSLGLILYEMATGKRAFERPESVQTLSAILTEEPPPIDRSLPGPLRWAIVRCLAKDPADRYDSTRDLHQELRSIRDHLSEASGTTAVATAAALPVPQRRLPWIVAAGFAGGVLLTAAALLFLRGPEVADQSSYRFSPFSFEPGGQANPIWSPDGKSVAYAARQSNGPFQLYVRSMDAPTPVQITHTAESAVPLAWTPDGQRILLNIARQPASLWSVAKVGGEPQVVMAYPSIRSRVAISPDGQAVTILAPGPDGRTGIFISAPPGAPLKKYTPEPFNTREVYNSPQMKFSPDGKQILLYLNGDRKREEAWLMPYPANPSSPPRQVLQSLEHYGGTPEFSWMPDNRRVVLTVEPVRGAAMQLWMADLRSGERHALTSGTNHRGSPSVSPDGQKLIFSETTGSFDVISVDLATAAAHPLVATERNEVMPAWAAKQPVLAYISDRSGPSEVWLHSTTGPDRLVATARDFPPDTTQWFMGPALSPEGDRVIYTRIERQGGMALWISSTAGNGVVRLTNDSASEFPGSWSPDGAWFAYMRLREGKDEIMKVKTTGQATPILLQANSGAVPVWSPSGDWIATDSGALISSDGKTVRSIGDHHSPAYMFSADGKLLYGLRAEADRVLLFSVDVATGSEKVIGDVGKDFRPASNMNPSIRFSLAPDGKSFVYSVSNSKTNLWMLEGFDPKRGFWSRLGLE